MIYLKWLFKKAWSVFANVYRTASGAASGYAVTRRRDSLRFLPFLARRAVAFGRKRRLVAPRWHHVLVNEKYTMDQDETHYKDLI